MVYLAMTAAELYNCSAPPEKSAWMACHFSPYGTGLTNIPASLPAESLLILNDRTPVCGHDPERIYSTLKELWEKLKCKAILLDFQRDCDELGKIAEKVMTLPCPVIVSEKYAGALDCPVFLPPVPLLKTVEEYLRPWKNREIWLEAALDGLQISLTEEGCRMSALSSHEKPDFSLDDNDLCCHYSIAVSDKEAIFTLQRSKNDLEKLLEQAEKLGVNNFVGLYQELGHFS